MTTPISSNQISSIKNTSFGNNDVKTDITKTPEQIKDGKTKLMLALAGLATIAAGAIIYAKTRKTDEAESAIKKGINEVEQAASNVVENASPAVTKKATTEVSQAVSEVIENASPATTEKATTEVSQAVSEVVENASPAATEKATTKVSQQAENIVKEIKLSGNIEERLTEMQKSKFNNVSSIKPEVKEALSKLKPETVSALSDNCLDLMCIGTNIKLEKVAQLEKEFTTKELQSISKNGYGPGTLSTWIQETVNSPEELQKVQKYLHSMCKV